eukprot:144053-Hanusia_phi.AAC.13
MRRGGGGGGREAVAAGSSRSSRYLVRSPLSPLLCPLPAILEHAEGLHETFRLEEQVNPGITSGDPSAEGTW